jgi:hypothetical protein
MLSAAPLPQIAMGPPGSRARCVHACQGLRPRGALLRLAMTTQAAWPSVRFHDVGAPKEESFTAQWLACTSPCQRFAYVLANADA